MRIWSDEDYVCHAKTRGKNVLELHLSHRYLRKFEIVVHLNQIGYNHVIHGGPAT